jgi:hypothetical protein
MVVSKDPPALYFSSLFSIILLSEKKRHDYHFDNHHALKRIAIDLVSIKFCLMLFLIFLCLTLLEEPKRLAVLILCIFQFPILGIDLLIWFILLMESNLVLHYMFIAY